jgi:16S rRNA (cytidine1402-2'-O)-methyltransferase
METPFRNNPMLDEILRSCRNDTKLCIASNLTAADEFVQTKTIGDWKKAQPELHKQPTIFVLYRTR